MIHNCAVVHMHQVKEHSATVEFDYRKCQQVEPDDVGLMSAYVIMDGKLLLHVTSRGPERKHEYLVYFDRYDRHWVVRNGVVRE